MASWTNLWLFCPFLPKIGRRNRDFLHRDWFLPRKSSHWKKIFNQKSRCQSHPNSKAPVYVSILHVVKFGLENRHQHRFHLELSLSSQHWKQGRQKCKSSHRTKRPWETLWRVNIGDLNTKLSSFLFFTMLGTKTQTPLFTEHPDAITTWTSRSSFP